MEQMKWTPCPKCKSTDIDYIDDYIDDNFDHAGITASCNDCGNVYRLKWELKNPEVIELVN